MEIKSILFQCQQKKLLNPRGVHDPAASEAVDRAERFHSNVRRLKRGIDEFYEKNVGKQWRGDSLMRVNCLPNTETVSALAVDLQSNIYAGFANGDIKIYKNSRGYGEITEGEC